MKIKLISIVGLMIIFWGCNSKLKNDLKEWNLNGKVESIKETPYSVIEKFGEIIKVGIGIYNSGGQSYTFNEKGNLIKELYYNVDGSISSMTEFKNNENGKRIEVLSYGSDNNLTNKLKNKYDVKGNLIESNYFNGKGDLIGKWKYEYDVKGNQISCFYYNAEGKLDSRNEYKYDGQGNKIEDTCFDSEGTILSIGKSKYDENGNYIEALYLSPVTGITFKQEYKYEFDEKHNWIKQAYYKNGKLDHITERIIKYYN